MQSPTLIDGRSTSAQGEIALQRLFSTFPGGRPGLALLLLRVAIGPGAITAGFLCLSGTPARLFAWVVGLALMAGGAALTIGFLTPIAGVVVGIPFLGFALGWLSPPASNFHETRLTVLAAVIISAALVLIGPGAFSVDGHLFGRREIVIPPSSIPKP